MTSLVTEYESVFNSYEALERCSQHISNLTAECFRKTFNLGSPGYYNSNMHMAVDMNGNSYQDATHGAELIEFGNCTLDFVEMFGTSGYDDPHYFIFPARWLDMADADIEKEIIASLERWVDSQKVAEKKITEKQQKDDIAYLIERAREHGYELTPVVKTQI